METKTSGHNFINMDMTNGRLCVTAFPHSVHCLGYTTCDVHRVDILQVPIKAQQSVPSGFDSTLTEMHVNTPFITLNHMHKLGLPHQSTFTN